MGRKRPGRIKDLLSIQERVNRLFEDVLERPDQFSTAHTVWSPLVDICEAEHEFMVMAELPEVYQEDIEIKIEENVLIISGVRKHLHDTARDTYHVVERKYGYFHRSFLLPTSVDKNSIKANLRDGVLTILLPKRTTSEPVQVIIE